MYYQFRLGAEIRGGFCDEKKKNILNTLDLAPRPEQLTIMSPSRAAKSVTSHLKMIRLTGPEDNAIP